jgi:hypothetical protein
MIIFKYNTFIYIKSINIKSTPFSENHIAISPQLVNMYVVEGRYFMKKIIISVILAAWSPVCRWVARNVEDNYPSNR